MASKTTGENTPLILGLLGLGGLAGLFWWHKKKKQEEGAPMAPALPGKKPLPKLPDTPTPDIKVGRWFKLSEFLSSKTFPKLRNYRPTPKEIENLRAWCAYIGDPLRDQFGPIVVNNGGRPPAVAAAYGTTWYDALKKQGYAPSKTSDHADFSGVDVDPIKVGDFATWNKVFSFLFTNPKVRQCIVYLKKQPDGTYKIGHIHVSVVRPDKPALTGNKRFYFSAGGKAVAAPEGLKPKANA